MLLLLFATALSFVAGCSALVLNRRPRLAIGFGAGGVILSALLGLLPALRCLISGEILKFHAAWSMPYGALSLGVDGLSAFFLALIFIICGVSAIYGTEYFAKHRHGRGMGPAWFFYNLLFASMVFVVMARNAMVFLMAWEVMALSSFFLVTIDDEREEIRSAGQIYLIATHLGVGFLFVFFIILGLKAGSFEFSKMAQTSTLAMLGPEMASVLFLLAIVGFGSKAGFVPFHVWLPEAYPAAPSHVSGAMSGIMTKIGIYGLLRILAFLGTPPIWWSWALIALGALGGVFGILFAIGQRNIKRFLAYSSIENIGIILLGIGVGLLGVTLKQPLLASLGFGGALLHIANHALFKTLLFLASGTVQYVTGTRNIDHLGGLFKKMPAFSVAVLLGVVAMCGLPPLNGFMSEFTIYLAAFEGMMSSRGFEILPFFMIMASLVLIGGLAAAGFAKVYGVVFLGEPRKTTIEKSRSVGLAMQAPVYGLAIAICLAAPLAPLLLTVLSKVVSPLTSGLSDAAFARAVAPVSTVVKAGGAFVLVVALVAFIRRRLLRRRSVRTAVTWSCGYSAPTAKMQYTGSSFVSPITELFQILLRAKKKVSTPQGIFPHAGSFELNVPDAVRSSFYDPLFTWLDKRFSVFRRLQHGRIQVYVLYIVLTLIVVLIWKFGTW